MHLKKLESIFIFIDDLGKCCMEYITYLVIGLVLIAVAWSFFQKPKPEGNKASPAILWMNGTYAVLLTLNQRNLNYVFGGVAKKKQTTELAKQNLIKHWGIHDLEEGNAMIAELTSERGLHNALLLKYVDEMQLLGLSRQDFERHNQKITSNIKHQLLDRVSFDATQEFADQAILAWDFGRAVYLLSDFYLAGMITKEDALQRSMAICQKIQQLFNSWHDFNRSYLYGFRFWLYSTETELKLTADQNTIKIIEKLEKQAHSPFQLDWNMRLEKDW